MNIPKTCENYAPSDRYAKVFLPIKPEPVPAPKSDIELQADIQARIFNAQTHQGAF